MVASLCMVPIVVALAAITLTPAGYMWFDYLMLITIGCFIYPVINLITIAALDIVSKKAIGTAAGFIGLLGYLGKMVELKLIGRFVDTYSATHGKDAAWIMVLYGAVGCGVLATLLLAVLWKLKPRA